MTIIDNMLVIDGSSLTMTQLIAFMQDDRIKVRISARAKARISAMRQRFDEVVECDGKVIYGLNTGLGRLKDYRISQHDQTLFQRNILHSHASGLGPGFNKTIVRLSMLLRANVFCRGNSGVRLALVQRLVDFINVGIVPHMPQIGSLGVGDLQPMAHLGLCLAGLPEGAATFQNEAGEATTGSITEILQKVGHLAVEFPFAHREALALLSGSTVLLAASIDSWARAQHLLDISDLALSLSLEAFRGEMDAFDPRIHEARQIVGQIETAERVRKLLSGSELVGGQMCQHFEGNVPRVQDPVSFRASPQVHGAVRDALSYVESVLAREINASTDNPLFFENEHGELESLSGGNFHGALLGYAIDLLGIVLTDLGVLSERRSARLLDPHMSYGLPYNLVIDAIGLNTGFALVQANATALVGEMRILANPASIGSIPAKNNQEDHNGMGMGAIRKALQILDHLEVILSVELLCASQGIDIILKHLNQPRLGRGSRQLHQRIRDDVPAMVTDCYTQKLIHNMQRLVSGESLTSLLTVVLADQDQDLSMIS